MTARSDLLSSCGLIKVGELVAGPLRFRLWPATVDVNRMTNRPQLQFVTDLYSASFYQRLWQRDLKLARHLRHSVIIALVKDSVKDWTLIPWTRELVEWVLASENGPKPA